MMFKRVMILLSLVLVIGGLVACGGGEEEQPAEAEAPAEDTSGAPDGNELIEQMRTAMAETQTAHMTVVFQVASPDGPVGGTAEFWGERPGKMRVEIASELISIDGIVAVADGEKGWAYNPREQTVIIAEQSQYKSQFRTQPELRDVLDFGEQIYERGFGDSQATVLGEEEVNGRPTYQVRVDYGDDPDLQGVNPIFYIDQATSLPQRMELTVERDELTASGFIMADGTIETDIPVDPALFTFEAREGVTVLDLSQLPSLPVPDNLPSLE